MKSVKQNIRIFSENNGNSIQTLWEAVTLNEKVYTIIWTKYQVYAIEFLKNNYIFLT